VQLCAVAGANAIGVISDESKRDFVMSLGAKGVINRNDFNCWGQLPKGRTIRGFNDYMKESPQVRQGDLGYHRQGQGRRFRVRTPGRGDLPGLRASS
jgi:crotonyl-CoA carboxylase/reductase